MKRRLYVQLGRGGDILNILPLCYRDWKANGVKPMLMVNAEFLSLLEGCSYVEPIAQVGRFQEIGPALMRAEQIAEEKGAEVICTQIYGENLTTCEDCWSFMRESWNRVPDAPAWGALPLVFDRRDANREQAVVAQLMKRFEHPEWPYVVLALEGTSSPFENAKELKKTLVDFARVEHVNVIDLSGFIAPRFYDLLGLLEGALSLLTIDSGLLHLAHALPKLPVIALVTREPDLWHGSPWRPQQRSRYFYDAFPEATCAAVRDALTPDGIDARMITHVWSDWRGDKMPYNDRRRIRLARQTWADEATSSGRWSTCEFREADVQRDARDVGDPVAMPYIYDMIEHAIAEGAKDIIALTNADVCFIPGITGKILDYVTDETAAFTHRFDFEWLRKPILYEAQARKGKWCGGSDAFFFTVNWWTDHCHEYDDYILGRERWDEVLRQLIKRHGGRCIPAAIYHETHDSYWMKDRERNAGNVHNRKLAKKWFLRSGYDGFDPWWWKLPGTDGP